MGMYLLKASNNRSEQIKKLVEDAHCLTKLQKQ